MIWVQWNGNCCQQSVNKSKWISNDLRILLSFLRLCFTNYQTSRRNDFYGQQNDQDLNFEMKCLQENCSTAQL